MGGKTDLDPPSKAQGWLTAVDASTGAVKWKYRSPRPMVAAVTTTAGNLVLTGELTGDFVAFDARNGDVLYRFNTGGPIGGGVVTYAAGGRQYIAVASAVRRTSGRRETRARRRSWCSRCRVRRVRRLVVDVRWPTAQGSWPQRHRDTEVDSTAWACEAGPPGCRKSVRGNEPHLRSGGSFPRTVLRPAAARSAARVESSHVHRCAVGCSRSAGPLGLPFFSP
jgi:hypothetical protein